MSTTPQEHDKAGWLLYHSVGMFPGQQAAMRASLEGFTTSWCRPGLQRWDDGLAARRQVLDLYARLLRAPADAVYAAENVTQAFAQFVGALGRARLNGKRVLIAADCFPSLHYMLTGLAPLLGYTLDTVPVDAAAGYVTDDGYIARWQDDVALAIITLVTSTASKRAGLQRLAAHGRAQGSLIAVDITQAAGIVDVDVSAPPSTSPPPPRSSGSAARPARPGLHQPGAAGRAPAAAGAGLVQPARSLQLGPGQILAGHAGAPLRQRHAVLSALRGLGAGLSWLLSPAAQGMRAHNQALSRKLIALADAKGYRLRSPRDASERGGSVMVELPAPIDAQALEARLATEGVLADTRGQVLRLSPGVLTQAAVIDELDRLLPAA